MRTISMFSVLALLVAFTSVVYADTPVTIDLKEMNSSGQSGTAELHIGDNMVVIDVTPAGEQLIHIHDGSCAELGGVAYDLVKDGNLTDGKLTHTLQGAQLKDFQTGAFAINLHKAGEPGVYTACGEIPAAEAMMMGSTSIMVTKNDTLGDILTDAEGRTLYLFFNDELNKSNCSGGCLERWPALKSEGAAEAGDGVAADRLGTIDREDGSKQVAYNGWPLYYYADDEKPGDAKGQDRGSVWYVLSPNGGPIQTGAAIKMAESSLGNILTDTSGRTLYMFTPDEPNKSTCSGKCAMAWPPLQTVGDPKAEEGTNAGLLKTTTREDGAIQVTYNGMPLYYYAKDVKPGDTSGQNVGTRWFVVSADGEAVMAAADAGAMESTPSTLPKTGAGFGPSAALAGAVVALLLIGTGIILRRRMV